MQSPDRGKSGIPVTVADPSRACGEGCGRSAVVQVDGDYVYCGTCLFHLLHLGREFVETVENADDHLQALQ